MQLMHQVLVLRLHNVQLDCDMSLISDRPGCRPVGCGR